MTGSSVVSNRDRDCLACRLVSGSGLIGAGFYVSYHSKKFNRTPGKVIMHSIAAALVLLGSARIFNLPPFRRELSQQ
ncbi:uncharacterized protein LOC135168256 [Diachasmimorpha longicaudata]|uniref:uncharacterized protein LOC135168256 n=1 Tax=Diachasmimorpha longicaudata TaxID=58733 RepID=UPI0030B917EC